MDELSAEARHAARDLPEHAVRLVDSGRRPLVSDRWQRVGKRVFDVLMSGIMLLAVLPIIAFVAIAILIESGGPVLFRSPRVGQSGRRFEMLKFRKMRADVPGPPVTTVSDPRFTRIGLWLTKTKLDEIPQLWNVLRGEMSLVGPRPEDPRFVAERREDYETILLAKQGITGLSQLAFYAEAEILDAEDPVGHYRSVILPAKVTLDRLYVSQATIWWDLRILFWSVRCCLMRRPVAVHNQTGALSAGRRNETGADLARQFQRGRAQLKTLRSLRSPR